MWVPTSPFFAVSVLVVNYHIFSEFLSLLVKTRSSQSNSIGDRPTLLFDALQSVGRREPRDEPEPRLRAA